MCLQALTHGCFANHVVEVNSCYWWWTRSWTEKKILWRDVGIWRQYPEAVFTHINAWAYQNVPEKSLHRIKCNLGFISEIVMHTNLNLMCSPCSTARGNDANCAGMWPRCDWRETRCGRGLGNALRSSASPDFLPSIWMSNVDHVHNPSSHLTLCQRLQQVVQYLNVLKKAWI